MTRFCPRPALLLAVVAVFAAGAGAGPAVASTYCIETIGSDAATGVYPDCWRTFQPAVNTRFVSGDIISVGPGRFRFPQSSWYMKPGVAWVGAGPYLTTVVVDTLAAAPFVRFRTGSRGSGAPTDLVPEPYGSDALVSNMRLLNEGSATIGVDVKVTTGDSAPRLGFLVIEGFPTGIELHPSSDERNDASTHAVLTNNVILGASDTGIHFLADVFYSNQVVEASRTTNDMVTSEGAGARVATLINDLRDATDALVAPILTNATIVGGAESAVVLMSSYDDGSGVRQTQLRAGLFAPEIANSILSGSDRYGLEETSPFTEAASVVRTAMGGNQLADRLVLGAVASPADPAGGNLSVTPLFVDLAGGDLHVVRASPTIDLLGPSDGVPPIDVDGQDRPRGPASDLGADEYVDCTATAVVTLTQAAVCTGDFSLLDATGSSVSAVCVDGPLYQWFVGGTLVGEGVQILVDPLVTTVYRLRVRCLDPRLSACFDEAQVTVATSRGPATAVAGPDIDMCLPPGPVSILLDGSGSTGDTLVYRWTASAGRIVSPTSARTELLLDLGDVTQVVNVTLLVAPGGTTCFTRDDLVVTLRPAPVADPGGPEAVIDSGGPTDRIPLDGTGSSGEGVLAFAWTTDLGTFEDTGTTTSALASPALIVPNAPGDQRGSACLTVTSTNGCTDTACTIVAVLSAAVQPPNDVSPTLRVRKREPTDVHLTWQDAPVDATHDLVEQYHVRTASRACGPFRLEATVPRSAGVNEYLDPVLHAPPIRRYYVIESVNAGGTGPRAPDGSLCP